MTRNFGDTTYTRDVFTVLDTNGAATSSTFQMDGLNVAGFNTVNPGFTSPMRLVGVVLANVCVAVNSPGDWTFRLRVNESTTDSYSFSFPLPAIFQNKTFQTPTGIITPANSTYHVQADGPSRNFVLMRASIEWERI